jgi:hypothetical protein
VTKIATRLLLAGFLSVIGSLKAQNIAQITGEVVDSSGAPVAGAEIVAHNLATNFASRGSTNSIGVYTVFSLPPGSYTITAQAKGFRVVQQSDITIRIDQIARLDFRLEVGAMSESVTVSASSVLLDEETSSLSQVIDDKKVEGLPLNGRSPFRLVQLTPGVLSNPASNGQFNDVPVATTWDTNFSINGGRNESNEFMIDGVPATAGFFDQITTIPTVDATQEFRVESNSVSAEWGRFSGGVVNVATKSGSNGFHGTAFDFLRNNLLNADEFFNKRAGASTPPFRMNQFGGTLGGPIDLGRLYHGKDRTFFFADYQGTRWRQGDVYANTLPTPLQRSGNFSETLNSQRQLVTIYNPFSTSVDPANPVQYVRDPFTGNAIPSSLIDPIAAKMITYYPLPNVLGNPVTGANNFLSNALRSIDENEVSLRVDHNFSSAYRIFGRFAQNRTTLGQPDYYGNVATPDTGSVGKTRFKQTTLALDNTVTLNSNTVLSIRYGFARWFQFRGTRSLGYDQTNLGYPQSLVDQYQEPVFPTVTVAGYAGLGGQDYTSTGQETHSLLTSLSKVTGRHTFKAGTDTRLHHLNLFDVAGAGGSYGFNNAFTSGPNPNTVATNTGNAFASLLLGTLNSGSVNRASGFSLQDWYFAGFVADDIRVNKRLTLNLGVRYETESPYTERRNQLVLFDTSLPNPAANAAFLNLKGALRFASSNAPDVYNWDMNNFSPRVGLAYSINAKTTFRAGAGIFYAPLEISMSGVGFAPNSGYSSSTPVVASLNGVMPFQTLKNPFPSGLIAPTQNALGASTYLGQSLSVWDANAQTPYTGQWNAGFERELPSRFVISVAYAGSRGVKLTQPRALDALNPSYLSLGTGLQALVNNPFAGKIPSGTLANPTVALRQLLLPYPQYTGVTVVNSTSGNSTYHSIQIKAEKHLTHGVSFLVSYTGGKLMSDTNNGLAWLGGGQSNVTTVQTPYNLAGDRSISELDIARNLVFSYVLELPFGPHHALLSNAHGLVARLVEGWQINGITTYRSGFPLVMTATVSGGGNRPNSTGQSAVLGGGRSLNQEISEWFNTTDFTQPAPFTLGNVVANLTRRPWTQHDKHGRRGGQGDHPWFGSLETSASRGNLQYPQYAAYMATRDRAR